LSGIPSIVPEGRLSVYSLSVAAEESGPEVKWASGLVRAREAEDEGGGRRNEDGETKS
jgi:hypothetical protein